MSQSSTPQTRLNKRSIGTIIGSVETYSSHSIPDKPTEKLVNPLPAIVELGRDGTVCIILSISAALFLGVVVLVIFGIATGGHLTTTSTTKITQKTISTEERQLNQKTFVKVIKARDLWNNFKGKANNSRREGTTILLHSIHEIGSDDVTCDPILSSVEYSCCCFVEKVSNLICNGDGTMGIDGPDGIGTFKVKCNIIYTPSKSRKSGHSPAFYFSLSEGFVNETRPITGKLNENECTLKATYVCLVLDQKDHFT